MMNRILLLNQSIFLLGIYLCFSCGGKENVAPVVDNCVIESLTYQRGDQASKITFSYDDQVRLISVQIENNKHYTIEYDDQNRILKVADRQGNYYLFDGYNYHFQYYLDSIVVARHQVTGETEQALDRYAVYDVNSVGEILRETVRSSNGALIWQKTFTWTAGNLTKINWYGQRDEFLTYDNNRNPIRNIAMVIFSPEYGSVNNVITRTGNGLRNAASFFYTYNESAFPTNYPLTFLTVVNEYNYAAVLYTNCK